MFKTKIADGANQLRLQKKIPAYVEEMAMLVV